MDQFCESYRFLVCSKRLQNTGMALKMAKICDVFLELADDLEKDPSFFMKSSFRMSEYLKSHGFTDERTLDELQKHEQRKQERTAVPYAQQGNRGVKNKPVKYMASLRGSLYEPAAGTNLAAAQPQALKMLKEVWGDAIRSRLQHNLAHLLTSKDGEYCAAKQTEEMKKRYLSATTTTDVVESGFALSRCASNAMGNRAHQPTVGGKAQACGNRSFHTPAPGKYIKRQGASLDDNGDAKKRRKFGGGAVAGLRFRLSQDEIDALTAWTVKVQAEKEKAQRELRERKAKRAVDQMEENIHTTLRLAASRYATAVRVQESTVRIDSASGLDAALAACAGDEEKVQVCQAQIRYRQQVHPDLHKLPAFKRENLQMSDTVLGEGRVMRTVDDMVRGLRIVFAAEADMEVPAEPTVRIVSFNAIARIGTPTPQWAELEAKMAAQVAEMQGRLPEIASAARAARVLTEMPTLDDMNGKRVAVKQGAAWREGAVIGVQPGGAAAATRTRRGGRGGGAAAVEVQGPRVFVHFHDDN
jgi:hypothetical protein